MPAPTDEPEQPEAPSESTEAQIDEPEQPEAPSESTEAQIGR